MNLPMLFKAAIGATKLEISERSLLNVENTSKFPTFVIDFMKLLMNFLIFFKDNHLVG
jgi:hypothetical protein